MEALLRRDTAAAADLTPVSWSVADSLTEQIHAVADETIESEHRVKDDPTLFGIWNALVTRIIATSSEEFRSAGCQAALQKEFSTRERQVWDEETVCEWHDAARQGTACVGRVLAIMGEKHAEVLKDPGSRTYKAWCVFAGNNVQTSNNRLGSSTRRSLRRRPRCRRCARRWPSQA